MDLELRGRTCLITGGSSGIGAGIARVLAHEGVRIAIAARHADRLEAVADELTDAAGGRPRVITGDMTRVDEVARIAREAVELLGQVDILVNNAGGSRPTTLDAGEDVWEESFALNFSAARRLTHALLQPMRDRRWGRIINISGSMEPRGMNAGGAAKGALHVWAKGLSRVVAEDGVTVNTIPPGRIDSEQIRTVLHPTEASRRAFIERHIPIGYFGEPRDIANLVAFLASPLARYITGDVIPVDGGMHSYAH